MDDPEPVRGVEGDRDLLHEPQGGGGLHRDAGAQHLGQRPPVDVLHRAPEEAIGGAGAVQGHDVRMLERSHEGGGALERLLGFGPRPRSAGNHLQRNRLIELQVTRQAHEGRRPAPVDGLELEQAAQVVARRGVDGIAPRGGRIDGGHRIVTTLNGWLVTPRPPELALSV